jgi:hypothetical protein
MKWQLDPPSEVAQEIDRVGSGETKSLIRDVRRWIEEGEHDDIALARAVIERGHSEEYAWWLVKESRMREVDEAQG